MSAHLSLQIADIGFRIEAPAGLAAPQAYRPFLAPGRGDFGLRLGAGPKALHGWEKRFESAPVWALYRRGGDACFRIFESYPELDRSLIIPEKNPDAQLVFHGSDRDPFLAPAIELLMITRLAKGGGAILHGCGVSVNGRGIVFAGESGAGKSTLARLLAAVKGVELLSDDRAVVRKEAGGHRLYGTPWHGEARFGAPGGVPLERILFLQHAQQNAVRGLPGARAVKKILQCAFLPFWDAAGTAAALEFVEGLVAGVPCAELVFVPDRSVVDFVLSVQAETKPDVHP